MGWDPAAIARANRRAVASSIVNSPATIADVPARTALSDTLSKALKQRGFRFVGTTICYAFMQAAGLVNDHTADCFRHPG